MKTKFFSSALAIAMMAASLLTSARAANETKGPDHDNPRRDIPTYAKALDDIMKNDGNNLEKIVYPATSSPSSGDNTKAK